MIVWGTWAKRMAQPVIALNGIGRNFQKSGSIRIFQENIVPGIPAGGDVINGTRTLYS